MTQQKDVMDFSREEMTRRTFVDEPGVGGTTAGIPIRNWQETQKLLTHVCARHTCLRHAPESSSWDLYSPVVMRNVTKNTSTKH